MAHNPITEHIKYEPLSPDDNSDPHPFPPDIPGLVASLQYTKHNIIDDMRRIEHHQQALRKRVNDLQLRIQLMPDEILTAIEKRSLITDSWLVVTQIDLLEYEKALSLYDTLARYLVSTIQRKYDMATDVTYIAGDELPPFQTEEGVPSDTVELMQVELDGGEIQVTKDYDRKAHQDAYKKASAMCEDEFPIGRVSPHMSIQDGKGIIRVLCSKGYVKKAKDLLGDDVDGYEVDIVDGIVINTSILPPHTPRTPRTYA